MLLLALFSAVSSLAAVPDWSEGALIPPGGRPNPYELPAGELERSIRQGRVHALKYPVPVTGLLIPNDTLESLFSGANDPLRRFIGSLFGGFFAMKSTDEVFEWVGLNEFPEEEGSGPYFVPFPEGTRPRYRMGFGLIRRHGGDGITLSCASCHSGNLFGRKVIGLSNRFPRANETFVHGKKVMRRMNPELFGLIAKTSKADREIYAETREHMSRVGIKQPLVLGLDTSLAQVALSLARRGTDEYATPDARYERDPRRDPLDRAPADSKPAVWWNLKYKNRWLSDGSVVSGNPIFTNFLWNEIGRGTDLRELEEWFRSSEAVVRELTTAVFASEAPRYTDFFDVTPDLLARAKRGEAVFKDTCQRCHGSYEKDWTQPDPFRTVRVVYHADTPVIDVGTDPARREGMTSLEAGLNPLAISRQAETVIRPQKGYVPPPLVGIWARWPYFHNNSAPSLCAVLTRHDARPSTYLAGEALDRDRDFDRECNGYPSDDRVPAAWKGDLEKTFDTRRPGMTNTGHDEGIFLRDGRELLSDEQKSDLIAFLQTL